MRTSSPPPGARERLVRKLLTEVPVSDAFVSSLTERENLTPAQIANALRFANLVEHEDASQLEAWMERQLAHAERNKVRASYNQAEYLEERRQMMQAWADCIYKV